MSKPVELATKLLQETARDGKSVVLSPLSVSVALFVLYLAADGTTKQQMTDVLGKKADESEVRLYFGKLIAAIKRENTNYTLSVANRLYVRQDSSTKPSFNRIINLYFREKLRSFDYRKTQEVVQEINGWISNETNNKITEMIRSDDINSLTRMLVLNAVYFKGTWEKQFIKSVTRDKPFHISETETKNIPTMVAMNKFPYYEDNSVQVLKMPYIGDKLEMVLILPKIRFGLSNVLKNLTPRDFLKYVYQAVPTLMAVKLPKFRVEKKMNLKESLEKIGFTDMFNENANFQELTKDPIFVSNVMHAGFIEVDEKGTESGAAIMIDVIDRIARKTVLFSVDQPFLFAIVKDITTVLFAGWIDNVSNFKSVS
uniref:Serpin domain-containing protein n=1 Tax=Setaria digitata TaxID=48799 RepID=A0A915PX37_9BILA